MEGKSKGSGLFAMIVGTIFLVAFFVSVTGWDLLSKITLDGIFKAWLSFSAIILLGWGIQRIRDEEAKGWSVGQNTLNFVVAILGATFAILAILVTLKPAADSVPK